MFDVTNGEARFDLPASDSSVLAVGYFAGGTRRYAVRTGGSIDIWNRETDTLEATRQIEEGPIKALNALGSQSRFLYQFVSTIKEYDPSSDETATVLEVAAGMEVVSAYRTRDGKRLAAQMRSTEPRSRPRIELVDLAGGGEVVAWLAGAYALCVSETSERIAFSIGTGLFETSRIEIWDLGDLPDLEPLSRLDWRGRGGFSGMAFGLTGGTFFVLDDGMELHRFDPTTGELSARRPVDLDGFSRAPVEAETVSDEPPAVPLVTRGEGLLLIDEATLTPIGRLPFYNSTNGSAGAFAASPDGMAVLVSSSVGREAGEYGLGLGEEIPFEIEMVGPERFVVSFETESGWRYEVVDSGDLKLWRRGGAAFVGDGSRFELELVWLEEGQELPAGAVIFEDEAGAVEKSGGELYWRWGPGEVEGEMRRFLSVLEGSGG